MSAARPECVHCREQQSSRDLVAGVVADMADARALGGSGRILSELPRTEAGSVTIADCCDGAS